MQEKDQEECIHQDMRKNDVLQVGRWHKSWQVPGGHTSGEMKEWNESWQRQDWCRGKDKSKYIYKYKPWL